MHPIEIVEDLEAFIPTFQDSQEKIVQKSYEILIFFVHSKDSQVSVWLFYTAVVGKTFICKPTSIGRSHAKKSNICLPS
jgi:hypothetical protein